MSYLVRKLDHFLVRKLCVATAFFESGHRKIRLGEDISFFTSLDEIDFGEDGYIWSYYDETLVYEMIDKANRSTRPIAC